MKGTPPHIYWLDRIGGWMLRLAVMGLVALTVVQLLMTSDPFRLYLSFAERMESRWEEVAGKGINPPEAAPVLVPANDTSADSTVSPAGRSGKAVLTLQLVNFTSLPTAVVRKNGKVVGEFSERRLTVEVGPGDIIEIDTSTCLSPVEFIITDASSCLAYPRNGLTLSCKSERVLIGPVKLK